MKDVIGGKDLSLEALMHRLATFREKSPDDERAYNSLMEVYRRVASGERKASSLSPLEGMFVAQIAFIVMREITLPVD